MAKRRISAEDLYRLQVISGCEISPDGAHVVFSLQRVDRKSEKKHSNLWIVSTQRGGPRQFTWGDQSDTSPKWSPDGSEVAFLSNRVEEKEPQIYIIPFYGGEARPVTKMKGRFGPLEWSPDGKHIVFSFRKQDPEEIERESDAARKKLGVKVRPITRIHYKENGQGFLPSERWHIWTLHVRPGRLRQLTDDKRFDELDPSWSPDGKRIVFVSNRSDDPDQEIEADDLFTIPSAGGRLRRIETPFGFKGTPRYSNSGKHIAYFGMPGGVGWWQNTRLYVVSTSSKAAGQDLTGAYDIEISPWTMGDIGEVTLRPPTWSLNDERIFFQVARHGTTQIHSVSTDGTGLRPLTEVEGSVCDFSMDSNQSKVIMLLGSFSDPGQIVVSSLDGRPPRQLTRFNQNWLRHVDLGKFEEVWIKGTDRNDLHGWILKPPGFRASRKYPSILQIHGGPRTQYGNRMMHEFLYLSAQGYVVHFCNPRGSQGYGEEHAKAIWNDWGTVDYADLMAWTNHVARKPFTDRSRMGVTGGSYGGYMTCWIVGHTNRFKAAVTDRCVSNLISTWGSSDFNWMLHEEFGKKPPWENFENLWRQSPMKHVGNVKTPTLVIHSEQDFRCALEQGEQFFVALKRLGVNTELVVFPEESHALSREGRTDRRVERLKRISSWFDRYLKK